MRTNPEKQFPSNKILLDFSPPSNPLPGSPAAAICNYALVYSLDIGSAEEFSVGGTLDPGDLYPQGYSGGLLTQFFRDDANWFVGDPHPDPLVAPSGAPVASGISLASVRDMFFNLNGAAFLGFDLCNHTIGPGQPALTRDALILAGENLAGILPPEFMLISYADSNDTAYTAQPGGAPTNSTGIGGPRGTTAAKDELLQVRIFPYTGSSGVIDPQFSEAEVDSILAPNPDVSVATNNDINALATVRDDPAFAGAADFLYLTASTEARYGLDPGVVYMPATGATGALSTVITPDDLGIPWGIDLNALEFTWLTDPATGETSLASGNIGRWYFDRVIAENACEPATFRITSGLLPDGLMLDAVTGLISGVPTVDGVFPIEIAVRDRAGNEAVGLLDVTVSGPPPAVLALDPAVFPPVNDGDPVAILLQGKGGAPPYQFKWAHGSPPAGLGINPATGTLSGTAIYPGTGIVPWQVTDSNGASGFALVPYTIWPSFPGGYPAWKAFHGVASDTENIDGDNYAAMIEYCFGLDPNLRDRPGLFRVAPALHGTWRVEFPSAGVPDVRMRLQRYDIGGNTWVPLQSNPFDPAGAPRNIIRLRAEE